MRNLAAIKKDHKAASDEVARCRSQYEALEAQGAPMDNVLLNLRHESHTYAAQLIYLEKEASECVQIGQVYELDLSIDIQKAKYFWRVSEKNTKHVHIERVGPVIGDHVPDKSYIKAIHLKAIEDEIGDNLNDLADLGF